MTRATCVCRGGRLLRRQLRGASGRLVFLDFMQELSSVRARVDEWTSGRVDEWTSGRVDEWTSGRVDEWTSGRVDEWTSGRVDEWTSGRVDEWTSGRVVTRRYMVLSTQFKTQNGDHVNKLISPHFFSSRFPRPPGLRLDLAGSGWSRLLNRGTWAGRIGRLGARRHVFHSGRYRGSDPSARRAAGVVCAATPAVAQRRAAGLAGRSSGAAARYRPPS